MEPRLEPRSEPSFLIRQVIAMSQHSSKQFIIPFHSQRRMVFTHWNKAWIPLEPRHLSTLLFATEGKITYSVKKSNLPPIPWKAIGTSFILKRIRVLLFQPSHPTCAWPWNSHTYSPAKIIWDVKHGEMKDDMQTHTPCLPHRLFSKC